MFLVPAGGGFRVAWCGRRSIDYASATTVRRVDGRSMLFLSEANAQALCAAALAGVGLPADEAAVCADAILFASLRGLDSHGIVSILPGICRAVATGRIDPGAEIQHIAPRVLKGNGAAGPVVGARTMRTAIDIARVHGIGAAVAFNCNHFGAASYYAALALEHGMIGICACNAGPNVAPFGGAQALHGTNPFAYAFPGGDEPPVVLDIATSIAAFGQVSKARRHGQALPAGWALDKSGQPTTDPASAATLLPFGGHKGYGIGILVDLLTAGLAASTIGLDVRQGENDRQHAGQSFFMLAIDPAAFGGAGAFTARADALTRQAHGLHPADGHQQVFMPGEIEHREAQRRRASGIPLHDEDWDALLRGLEAAGLPSAQLGARFAPHPG
jgi:ureidoglycolate dehydrogenase (NAD+)